MAVAAAAPCRDGGGCAAAAPVGVCASASASAAGAVEGGGGERAGIAASGVRATAPKGVRAATPAGGAGTGVNARGQGAYSSCSSCQSITLHPRNVGINSKIVMDDGEQYLCVQCFSAHQKCMHVSPPGAGTERCPRECRTRIRRGTAAVRCPPRPPLPPPLSHPQPLPPHWAAAAAGTCPRKPQTHPPPPPPPQQQPPEPSPPPPSPRLPPLQRRARVRGRHLWPPPYAPASPQTRVRYTILPMSCQDIMQYDSRHEVYVKRGG
jgi:hypothetical protein